MYYKISTIVVTGIIFAGLLLQLFSVETISFAYPRNVILGIILLILFIVQKLWFKSSEFFQWISSIQNSIVSIVAMILLCLIMAIIPQQLVQHTNEALGLSHVIHTHYFQFLYLYLLITLGSVVARRLILKFSIRNIAFFLNHAGFWLILYAGGLGSYDFEKVNMIAKYNNPTWYGYTENNEYKELPFAIELQNFQIDYFLPKIQLVKVDSSTKPISNKIVKQWELDTLRTIKYKSFSFNAEKYIPYTWWWNDSMLVVKTPGYIGSAYIRVVSQNLIKEGWISYSSVMQKGKYLKVSQNEILLLAEPLPKKYLSEVKIFTKNGEQFKNKILVNKPINIMGWNVYQKDYHKELGEFSDYSVFEINKDPWLSIVYIGIFMLMIGSILLVFNKN